MRIEVDRSLVAEPVNGSSLATAIKGNRHPEAAVVCSVN
jgi:hypothetical protein